MPRHGRRLALLLAAALLAPACGRDSGGRDELILPGEGAAAYGSTDAPTTRESALVAGRLAGVMELPPSPDACLERAAAILAGLLGPQCEFWESWAEEAALRHAGCADTGVDAVLACTNGSDPKPFLDQAAAEVPKLRSGRFGVARAPRGLGGSAWALLASERRLKLAPVPRRVAPGDRLRLEFELEPGLSSPRAYLMTPEGGVEPAAVQYGAASGAYLASLSPPAKGRYWVEIMASGAEGPAVLALFPVYSGESPPGRASRPRAVPVDASTPEAARGILLDLLNRERRSRGLPPVEADPRLAEAAASWAAEMRRLGRVVHVGPDGRGPGERASEAGAASRAINEVLASGGTVGQAHDALMASPAHRGAMLDPRFTRAGIGVSMEKGGRGPSFYVAEELSIPRRVMTPEEAARKVLERIAGHRAAFALKALEEPGPLARAAQSLAAAAGASPEPGFLAARVSEELAKEGWRGTVDAAMQSVFDPEDFVLPASLGDPGAAGAGVGVLFTPEGEAGGSYLVVLLVATGA